MATSRLLNSSQVGFWEIWLPVVFGDVIIVIRLLAYVLLLCTFPGLLAAKVSEVLGTVSAIFLTSIYIFFQIDVFEQSVTSPIHRASEEIDSPSTQKEYEPSSSDRKSNILRRTCASIGKLIDNKKSLPKEIANNFMIPWGDNESSQENITGPEITRKKFKILFLLIATIVMLLIFSVPGFNALAPLAVSKYLISIAVKPGIANFATAILFGGFTYALRAPLVAGGIALHYLFTKDPDTKKRLIGLASERKKTRKLGEEEGGGKEEKHTEKNRDLAESTVIYLKALSPPSSPPASDNESLDASLTSTGKNDYSHKMMVVGLRFNPKKPPNEVIIKLNNSNKGDESYRYRKC